MKTIVISYNEFLNKPMALAGITPLVLRWSFAIIKNTILFASKKEAIKALKGYKHRNIIYIKLNKNQLRTIKNIKVAQKAYYIDVKQFLEIEKERN